MGAGVVVAEGGVIRISDGIDSHAVVEDAVGVGVGVVVVLYWT